jgi:formylglycine-generating enzyme required for sulfatase activity
MNKLFFFLLSITCLSYTAYPQSITNITASQSGKNIVVNYNLTGKEEIKAYEIKLYVSPNGGSTWQGPLTAVTGDVGKGQAAANSKSITWDVLNEPNYSQLKGDNIQFKIKAFYQGMNDIEMVWVEGGTFMMGSNEGEEDEKPVHEVNLKGFYMGKYEVTRGQFRKFVEATKYLTDAENLGWAWMWSKEDNLWVKKDGLNWRKDAKGNECYTNKEEHPVIFVSHSDVEAFIAWLISITNKNYRLPTEAEWEYAAKGGVHNSKFKFSGSDLIDEVAWYLDDANYETHRVGTKNPNQLGIYDMTGNVWEWCSDWYDENYYQYTAKNNPEGRLKGDYLVLRGGSWSYDPTFCRISDRAYNIPRNLNNNIGFRLALD